MEKVEEEETRTGWMDFSAKTHEEKRKAETEEEDGEMIFVNADVTGRFELFCGCFWFCFSRPRLSP